MSDPPRPSFASVLQRNLIAGILTVIPLLITYLIVKYLFDFLKTVGQPGVILLADKVRPTSPGAADLLINPWFQGVFAVLLVMVGLCVLGWFAANVIGRKLIAMFDGLMQRLPLVKTIYGSVKMLLSALQQKPEGTQRVVLIDFPSPEMKTVGLVTKTFQDADTGRELAAVYVPTTPNPTSGYLEIVPLDRVTTTNWTVDEAMTFIMSGGAVTPRHVNYEKGAAPAAKQG